MASVLPERQSVNGRAVLNQMFEEAYRSIEQAIAQRLMLWLEAALTTLLGREPHERRAHVRYWVEQHGECAKCHSHESRRFSRNGSRPRTLRYRHLFQPRQHLQHLCHALGRRVDEEGGYLFGHGRPCSAPSASHSSERKSW